MLLDWLLKTEEGNISYEEHPRTGLDGVNEDGNLPYGRALQIERERDRVCISPPFVSMKRC